MFFTGSLLIEVMFSLNGLGLLGYDATPQRDHPVMFGTLYIHPDRPVAEHLSDITHTPSIRALTSRPANEPP